MKNQKTYDTIIIGGGVVGSALYYTISNYTNLKNITLIEKYQDAGLVNSACNNNSQTLHFGDIETNYTLEKATKVKEAADMVKNYLEKFQPQTQEKLFHKTHKMVLAVGQKEVQNLQQRHQEFKKLFPELKKINNKQLAKIEPKITEGRPKNTPLLALKSPDGYAIDYGALSKSFIQQTKKQTLHFNQTVKSIQKHQNHFIIQTNKQTFKTRSIIVAAGCFSLGLAQQMGYGTHYGLLPVAGNFFKSKKTLLNGKVYTLQMKRLPFAAIHGDPHVLNPKETRFGPTAKVLPLLERHHIKTFIDFLKTSSFTINGIKSLFKIISDPILFKYILKNFFYDIPYFGKRSFLKEIQKIIPTVTTKDIQFSDKIGGIRPQIVNTKTKTLQMGEAKIIENRIIFNITPSPGASTCLKNAAEDAQTITKMLGEGATFNRAKFYKDHL